MNHLKYPLIVLLCLILHSIVFGQTIGCSKLKLGKGLKLKSCRSEQLFDSQQAYNILYVKPSRKIDLVFREKDLVPTSSFGMENRALAAVNAGFFDMKEGGSVTFLKSDDVVIDTQETDSELLAHSLIAIDEEHRLHILSDSIPDKYTHPDQFDDVLFTGPLLLKNGKPVPLLEVPFNLNRHPRTAACILKNGRTLLFTVDGRHEEAAGMNLSELTQLMQKHHCQQGINLDGGGSTTMWTQSNGVVNHPSDNQQFDHEGERKVANALVIY